jgi:sugar lactone lactonase YvrE
MARRTTVFTEPHTFTAGIEGPACDAAGNVYAVCVKADAPNTIGKVSPAGEVGLFLTLPAGMNGCGMRIDPTAGVLYAADHTGHNVLRVRLDTKEAAVHAHEPRMNQPNDLAIASSGVLFASDPDWDASTGQLWRIDPDGRTTLLETGMGTTNGIEISPDERTLYVNESVQRTVWAYDLTETYGIRNKRLLHRFDEALLDGMRCDTAGNLYVTRFGAGVVAVLSPEGELLEEIKLIGKNCTNLTFGGPDGRTVYVTVSDNGNIETFRADVPGRCWAMWRL